MDMTAGKPTNQHNNKETQTSKPQKQQSTNIRVYLSPGEPTSKTPPPERLNLGDPNSSKVFDLDRTGVRW